MSVQQHLDTVWRAFRAIGVADDLTIIQHVAAVLLEEEDIPLAPDNPAPQKYEGSEFSTGAREEIASAIQAATEEAGGPAEVLDPYAIFRLTKSVSRGQYPTPRHVVKMMHRVAGVTGDHDVADLACGSGGFLAYRPHQGSGTGITMGVEIALSWARIAYANALLRLGPDSVTVLHQNALSGWIGNSAASARRFDRVLMNPPFGDKVDRKLVDRAGIAGLAGRSETVLTALALESLRDDGRAAVLMPAGPLFSNGKAETALRRRLIENHHLHAVVALPPDAFQPFSEIQTYLALVDKAHEETGRTWFFRLGRDGYPAGQSRDLTQEPGDPSDFPLLEAALGVGPPLGGPARDGHEDVLARVVRVPSAVQDTPATEGVVLEATADAVIEQVEWHAARDLPEPAPKGPLLLVTLSFPAGERTLVVEFDDERPVQDAGDAEAWREGRYLKIEKREGERDTGEGDDSEVRRTIYAFPATGSERVGGGALVVTIEGILLGRTVPHAEVRRSLDPRPETYVIPFRQQQAQKPAAVLIANIRERQRETARLLDTLADTAGATARRGSRPVPFEGADALPVFGTLSPEQERVYRAVLERPVHEVREAATEPYAVVSPFTAAALADELYPGNGASRLAVVQQTLSILEAMGVVVRAHLPRSTRHKAMPYYRVTTSWDEPSVVATPASDAPQVFP